jgi:hypothetical protein
LLNIKTPKISTFLWGAATSSYQTEGGITNNDWDYFTRSKKIKNRIAILTKPRLLWYYFQLKLQPIMHQKQRWHKAVLGGLNSKTPCELA